MKKWFNKYQWFRPEYHTVDRFFTGLTLGWSLVTLVVCILAFYTEVVIPASFLTLVMLVFWTFVVACATETILITWVDKNERKLAGK